MRLAHAILTITDDITAQSSMNVAGSNVLIWIVASIEQTIDDKND